MISPHTGASSLRKAWPGVWKQASCAVEAIIIGRFALRESRSHLKHNSCFQATATRHILLRLLDHLASAPSGRALIRDSGVGGVQSTSPLPRILLRAHSSDLSPAWGRGRAVNLQSDHQSSSLINHSCRPLIPWLLFSLQTHNVGTHAQGSASASSSLLSSVIKTPLRPFSSKHHTASPCLCL